MPTPLYQVDAFCTGPFTGNPAAVCLLEGPGNGGWMQSVAAELNLSETAFAHPEGDGFALRWFTPAVEVELCGHATLATAHILWETDELDPMMPARFQTRGGMLSARRKDDRIELDFPATFAEPTVAPEGLFAALGLDGVEALFVARSRFDLFVVVESAAIVRALEPDHTALRSLAVRGVIVTGPGDEGFDVVSRFFAPGAGVDEDAVTGSAHCAIAPYWSEKLDKSVLRCFQASARGGEVETELVDERVRLRGQAMTTLRGELLV